MYAISDLNQMSQTAFVTAFGAVFEHTPAIAIESWAKRPFKDANDLHQKMVDVVKNMSPDAQLALIRAHPDLGSKLKMAKASIEEQAGVGLDRLSPAEYDRWQSLNQSYKDKFGFPFIIAVKNHTKASILEAFELRLQNNWDVEKERAIDEITEIARLRLIDLIK